MGSPIEIKPVQSKRQLDAFVKLPFSVYESEPAWVAPLTWERKRFLNRKLNPFFKHGSAEYFLAYRDGQPVGRLSAHVDLNFQKFHKNKTGFFGFFECINDRDVAKSLLDAAREWLKKQGCDRMIGPCDFTTNDPCGLLIEGFETPPIILTPWNHSYYQSLIEESDCSKAMDLLMWRVEVADETKANPILWRLAGQVEKRHGITLRSMRLKDLEADLNIFRNIYNVAWEKNWGFVPLTADEVRHHAKELKPIIDPRWTFIAENPEGEPVGAALTLPDYNQVLSRLNGRLLPFGWVKALYYKRKINRVRVLALGIVPEYRHTGVAAQLYKAYYDVSKADGVTGGEMGWVLETNRDMNKAMEAMAGEVSRRLRIYESNLN